jgi:SRSO17 transposase
LHKTGHRIEKAYYYRSGKTKRKEWGHCLVNSIYTDNDNNTFPISADIYLRKEVCDETYTFKTRRELLVEQLDFALNKKIPLWLAIIDNGYYSHELIKAIKHRKLKYLAGVHINNKIFIGYNTIDEKYLSVEEYINKLTEKDYESYLINKEKYFVHINEVFIKQLGKQRIIVSYKDGDVEIGIKAYITNIFGTSNKQILMLLLKRWNIEGFHRDAKQHLGLESYQVRKYRAVQKYVHAILLAYTLLILNKKQSILEKLKRKLRTIGELCRFFKLIALKGATWLRRKSRSRYQIKEILNKYILVKNAKV